MQLNRSSKLCFLLSKHANDMSRDFVMNYGHVVFIDDVNTSPIQVLGIENRRTITEGGGGGEKVGVSD